MNGIGRELACLAGNFVARIHCKLHRTWHGANSNDTEMMGFLDRAAVSYQIVMTKLDQVKAADKEIRRQQLAELVARHPAARSEIIATSSEDKTGIADLQIFLAGFAAKEIP